MGDLPEAPRGYRMGLFSSRKQEWEREASLSRKSCSAHKVAVVPHLDTSCPVNASKLYHYQSPEKS